MVKHYYRIIFTAVPKSIFTAGLGAGGEISALKIDYHRRTIIGNGGENVVITAGLYYRPTVKVRLSLPARVITAEVGYIINKRSHVRLFFAIFKHREVNIRSKWRQILESIFFILDNNFDANNLPLPLDKGYESNELLVTNPKIKSMNPMDC